MQTMNPWASMLETSTLFHEHTRSDHHTMKPPQFVRESAAAIQSQVRRIARSIVNGDDLRRDHLQKIRSVANGQLVVVPAAEADQIATVTTRLERWHDLLEAGDTLTVQREIAEITGKPAAEYNRGGTHRV